mmetsp:Transcript_3558/g.8876  ORF Transcript_3558/g.8876 Transcript_3558/m.8876 type:complete len:904 (+) Transcript_3558:44-2755(+)
MRRLRLLCTVLLVSCPCILLLWISTHGGLRSYIIRPIDTGDHKEPDRPDLLAQDALHFRGMEAAAGGLCRIKLRFRFQHVQGYVLVSIIDPNTTHIEFGKGSSGPSVEAPIEASPMLFERNFTASLIHKNDCAVSSTDRSIQGGGIRVRESGGCLEVHRFGKRVTELCADGWAAAATEKGGLTGVRVDAGAFSHAYGVGQQLMRAGKADGDWVKWGRFGSADEFGNEMRNNPGTDGDTTRETTGKGGMLQFPFLLALPKPGHKSFLGLLLDNTYKQSWDFSSPDWWTIATPNTPVHVPHRLFVIVAEQPLDVRSRFMRLVGTPPVPPRKAFGLWMSEYGFESWEEADAVVKSVRDAHMPIDGIVLDLSWFGGIRSGSPQSSIGALDWDTQRFPEPREHIEAYRRDDLGVIAIEESYVSAGTLTYRQMREQGYLAVNCSDRHTPISLSEWWGEGSMIDWTNEKAARWVHDNRRFPNIIRNGVLGHWTDLGEPSNYDRIACYHGGKRHADVHNLYNFLWLQSIYEGYVRDHRDNRTRTVQRPFMLSRAGTLGIHRFGAAMWSGDIASRLDALAMHMQAQANMVTVGIDYYGTDTGGFKRWFLPNDTATVKDARPSEDEMFSKWLAASVWFDIPLRVHTSNIRQNKCPSGHSRRGCTYRISPAEIGWIDSNRFNIRQRYELVPYFYALAHRAFQHGLPVIAPLWYYFPADMTVRLMAGSQKMVGPDIMVAFAARHGQTHTDVYLPDLPQADSHWHSYHHPHTPFAGGQWLRNVSLFRAGDGVYTLPAYVRSGAILPMTLDQQQGGVGEGGSVSLRVFASREGSEFEMVVADDGRSVDHYDTDTNRPVYRTFATHKEQTTDLSCVCVWRVWRVSIALQVACSGVAAFRRPNRRRRHCRPDHHHTRHS